jgi:hypothetical protein
MAYPLLILSDITPFCAATCSNRNLVVDDFAAVALKRIELDGSPTRPFPLHQVSTGSSLTVHQTPALPTAPSTSTEVLSSTLRGSILSLRTTTSHCSW